MTDFRRVEQYYEKFDEWNRTFTPEGMMEFEITLEIMKELTRPGERILDLGGGPGRYTRELAAGSRLMTLGDISPELVRQARENTEGMVCVESLDVVNAVDLDCYGDDSFDGVLLMGPLYHLTDEYEIGISLREVSRVLKPGGLIIAGFIPLLSGTAGIIERSIYAPAHVTSDILAETYRSGVFRNNSEYGFQEGKYLSPNQVECLMENAGFEKKQIRSVRGLGYRMEKGILSKREEDPELYETIIGLIEKTAEEIGVVNSCGHALYIGFKRG